MCISGTEPSSVIRSQISSLKSWKVKTKKLQNKLKTKQDGVINLPNYILHSFQLILNSENIDAPAKHYESTGVNRRT